MGRIKEILQAYRTELASVIRNEYKAVFTDGGVLLVMVLAIFIYSTLYASAYAPEVLRNVPIGVIDESQTPSSRELIRTFDAGPNTYVAYEPSGMEEAEELFFARKIYGVVYIPQDYERQLLGGSSAAVSLYVDASYFLMYRQVFQELVTGIGQTGAMVQFQRLIAKGADIPQATAATQPVIYQSHNLFIPYLGYGSFIMPAIIIVIIQQTLLIGIGMIGGTWREFGLYRKLIPANCKRMYTLPIVLGKALVYISIYAVTLLYIMTVHYKLFHYPSNGSTEAVVGLLVRLSAGLHHAGNRHFDAVPLPRTVAAAAASGHRFPSCCSAASSFPREAIPEWLYTLGAVLPEQQRRQRLHPDPDDGRFAAGRDARTEDSVGAGLRLRRVGLHRHPRDPDTPEAGRRRAIKPRRKIDEPLPRTAAGVSVFGSGLFNRRSESKHRASAARRRPHRRTADTPAVSAQRPHAVVILDVLGTALAEIA